jgi:hypothetical protein
MTDSPVARLDTVGRGGRGRGLLLITLGATEVRLWSVTRARGAPLKAGFDEGLLPLCRPIPLLY